MSLWHILGWPTLSPNKSLDRWRDQFICHHTTNETSLKASHQESEGSLICSFIWLIFIELLLCAPIVIDRGKIRKSLLPPIWGESREDRWQQTETIHNSAESVSALLGGGRIWEDFGVDSFDQKPEKTQGVSHICLKEGHLSKCQVRPWGGSLCLRKSKETGISK